MEGGMNFASLQAVAHLQSLLSGEEMLIATKTVKEDIEYAIALVGFVSRKLRVPFLTPRAGFLQAFLERMKFWCRCGDKVGAAAAADMLTKLKGNKPDLHLFKDVGMWVELLDEEGRDWYDMVFHEKAEGKDGSAAGQKRGDVVIAEEKEEEKKKKARTSTSAAPKFSMFD